VEESIVLVAGGGGWDEDDDDDDVLVEVSGEDGGVCCSLPNPFPDFLAIDSPLSIDGSCAVVHDALTRGVVKALEEVVIAQRTMI